MMVFHILMSFSDHELMLDNFLITSSVGDGADRQTKTWSDRQEVFKEQY